jgi:hypothetical protein
MEQENCLNYRYLQDPYGCTHKSNIIYSKSFLVLIYVCVCDDDDEKTAHNTTTHNNNTTTTLQHNNTRRFQRLS